jgi:hypothetical protein
VKKKHQFPIFKSQINHIHQIRNSKQNRLGDLIIGFWELFGICDLKFKGDETHETAF